MNLKILVLIPIFSMGVSLHADEVKDLLGNVEWSVTKQEYQKAINQLGEVRNAIEAEFQKKVVDLLPTQINGFALHESKVLNSLNPIKQDVGFNKYQLRSAGGALKVQMTRSYLDSSSGRGVSVRIGDSDVTGDCFDPTQSKETVGLNGGTGYIGKDGSLCSTFSQFRVAFKATGNYKPIPSTLKLGVPSSEANPQELMKRDLLSFAQQFPLSQLDMFLQRAR